MINISHISWKYLQTQGIGAEKVGMLIANLQNLGLIPLPQINKFLRRASLQIVNPQFLMVNPQITNRKFLGCYSPLNANPQVFHQQDSKDETPFL